MIECIKSFHNCRRGSAAVEMALVTPFLLTLIFGSFELGNYFLDNHIVAKAVRDGARYAARQSYSAYSCSSITDSNVVTAIRNLVRTGQITSGGSPRVPGWSDATTINIAVSCNSSFTTGIYRDITTTTGGTITAGAPVVTSSADVPYSSLFSFLFTATRQRVWGSNLAIHARSQAPVTGI